MTRRLKKPAPVKAVALSVIGLSALSVWLVFLWPACSALRPEPEAKDPAPLVEIRELRASVADLTQAMDGLAEMNLRLADENHALKSMLIHCMKDRMKNEKK
jgi:hypothetical protein